MPILKLKKHNEKKEIEFELKYLKSLLIKQRFEMMFKKSKEMINLLEKSGYSPPEAEKLLKEHKVDYRRINYE